MDGRHFQAVRRKGISMQFKDKAAGADRGNGQAGPAARGAA